MLFPTKHLDLTLDPFCYARGRVMKKVLSFTYIGIFNVLLFNRSFDHYYNYYHCFYLFYQALRVSLSVVIFKLFFCSLTFLVCHVKITISSVAKRKLPSFIHRIFCCKQLVLSFSNHFLSFSSKVLTAMNVSV